MRRYLQSYTGPVSTAEPVLPATVVPCSGGFLVFEVHKVGVVVRFRLERAGPDVAVAQMTSAQWAIAAEDIDVAVIASNLGLMNSPAGLQ